MLAAKVDERSRSGELGNKGVCADKGLCMYSVYLTMPCCLAWALCHQRHPFTASPWTGGLPRTLPLPRRQGT
ncbi:predicted protein [Botrytis cinerea T4]|uniref:Uncharacterized protein n=1 Tax=Botryotinia fuckeliana (strain T4) TaxID=999810 RepID=G2XWA1_BOTF4|nr:predicted protein [Botrytis cinerea T4]